MRLGVIFSFILLVLMGCQQKQQESNSKIENAVGLEFDMMDTTVSPSKDFYTFANGGWMERTEIPEDRSRWGAFDELRKRTIDDVLQLLENPDRDQIKAGSDQEKAIIFYQTAMDTVLAEDKGISPIASLLSLIDDVKTKSELQNFVAEHQAILGQPFYGLGASADLNNSAMNTVYFSTGAQGLPDRDYYLDETEDGIKIQEAYKDHLKKMFMLIGIPQDIAGSQANAIYEFEKELAETRLTKIQKRNTVLMNNPRSVEDLKNMQSNIDWSEYIEKMNAPAFDSIIIPELKYAKSFNKIWASTPLETLKAYTKWTLLNQYAAYLNKAIVDQNFDFYGRTLSGSPEMKARWERVLSQANNSIGEAIGKLYVEKHFPPAAKAEAEYMVNTLLEAFGDRIKNLSWMSDSTKQKALEKLDNFTVKIGYPDEWKDYSEMKIQSKDEGGSYAGNMMEVAKWSHQKNIEKVGKAVDKKEWYMAPQVVNAYYHPLNNEIVFPAAILQYPFFDFKADAPLNYGGIGAVIGHEISHGFDDQGSRFDAKGNLVNWWTDKDKEQFEARTTQLVEQYNTYEPLPDVYVNGEFTLGENIGDLGGINVAYDGLQRYYENKEKVESVQGFSPEQRFFLSWATIWRTKMRDEEIKKRVKTDPHSPGQYRAIGPIVNMDAFYEAFDITDDSPLYKAPSDRVKIW